MNAMSEIQPMPIKGEIIVITNSVIYAHLYFDEEPKLREANLIYVTEIGTIQNLPDCTRVLVFDVTIGRSSCPICSVARAFIERGIFIEVKL